MSRCYNYWKFALKRTEKNLAADICALLNVDHKRGYLTWITVHAIRKNPFPTTTSQGQGCSPWPIYFLEGCPSWGRSLFQWLFWHNLWQNAAANLLLQRRYIQRTARGCINWWYVHRAFTVKWWFYLRSELNNYQWVSSLQNVLLIKWNAKK